MKRIRKAVLPVAGLGTRFLPATKAVPKEMLTVVDRPVVQHVVDEARAAGIEHFVFVTGRGKGAIYKRGILLRTVNESEMVQALMEEIDKFDEEESATAAASPPSERLGGFAPVTPLHGFERGAGCVGGQ